LIWDSVRSRPREAPVEDGSSNQLLIEHSSFRIP
jgi:hypothetical protein